MATETQQHPFIQAIQSLETEASAPHPFVQAADQLMAAQSHPFVQASGAMNFTKRGEYVQTYQDLRDEYDKSFDKEMSRRSVAPKIAGGVIGELVNSAAFKALTPDMQHELANARFNQELPKGLKGSDLTEYGHDFRKGMVSSVASGVAQGWAENVRESLHPLTAGVAEAVGIPSRNVNVDTIGTTNPLHENVTKYGRVVGGVAPVGLMMVSGVPQAGIEGQMAAQGFGGAMMEANREGYTAGQTAALGIERAAFNILTGRALVSGTPGESAWKAAARTFAEVGGINISQAGLEAELRQSLGLQSPGAMEAMIQAAKSGEGWAQAALFAGLRGVTARYQNQQIANENQRIATQNQIVTAQAKERTARISAAFTEAANQLSRPMEVTAEAARATETPRQGIVTDLPTGEPSRGVVAVPEQPVRFPAAMNEPPLPQGVKEEAKAPTQPTVPPKQMNQVEKAQVKKGGFKRLLEQMDRDELHQLAGEAGNLELTDDNRLIFRDTRSGTGRWSMSKSEFIDWLMGNKQGDDPLSYSNDEEWTDLIQRARRIVTGQPEAPTQPTATPPQADTPVVYKTSPTETPAPAKAKEPWENATVEDESRWYGTRIEVAPQMKGDEGSSGIVTRVFNNGKVVEYKPDGVDGTFRVNSDQVKVVEVKDSGPKKDVVSEPQPKAAPTLNRDPLADPFRFAAELKARGIGQQEAWSRYVQAWGLRGTELPLNAKEFYKIYRQSSPADYPDLKPPTQGVQNASKIESPTEVGRVQGGSEGAGRGRTTRMAGGVEGTEPPPARQAQAQVPQGQPVQQPDAAPEGKVEGPTSKAPNVKLEDIPRELAYRAHAGTSHVPEERAAQEQKEYVRHMEAVYESLSKHADTPERKTLLDSEFERYRQGYLDRTKALLQSNSRIMSTMITGPSNFPVRRMEKANNASYRRLTELLDYDKKAQNAIRQKLLPETARPISSDNPNAPELLRQKIDEAQALQDRMKAVNAAYRDFKKNPASLDNAVISDVDKNMIRTFKPEWSDDAPFRSYQLTNNLANIKRMQGRVGTIEQKRSDGGGERAFTGGKVVDNVDANRLQIIFDAKPNEAMRGKLKTHGFRWAPSEGAWQRFRGGNSETALRMLGLEGLQENAPETPKAAGETNIATPEPTKPTQAAPSAAPATEQPRAGGGKVTHVRKTPREGTPEREALKSQFDAMRAKEDTLDKQVNELEKLIENTRSGTKKKEQLEAKLQKVKETRHQFNEESKDLRDTMYRQHLEDVIEKGDEANQIAAKDKLEGGKREFYDKVKELAKAEATRQGLSEEDAESAAMSAASMITSYPGNRTLEKQIEIERRHIVRNKAVHSSSVELAGMSDLKGFQKTEFNKRIESEPENVESILTEARKLNEKQANDIMGSKRISDIADAMEQVAKKKGGATQQDLWDAEPNRTPEEKRAAFQKLKDEKRVELRGKDKDTRAYSTTKEEPPKPTQAVGAAFENTKAAISKAREALKSKNISLGSGFGNLSDVMEHATNIAVAIVKDLAVQGKHGFEHFVKAVNTLITDARLRSIMLHGERDRQTGKMVGGARTLYNLAREHPAITAHGIQNAMTPKEQLPNALNIREMTVRGEPITTIRFEEKQAESAMPPRPQTVAQILRAETIARTETVKSTVLRTTGVRPTEPPAITQPEARDAVLAVEEALTGKAWASQDARTRIVEAAKKLPTDLRGDFLHAVAIAKNETSLQNALERMDHNLARYHLHNAVDAAAELLAKHRLANIPPEYQEQARQAAEKLTGVLRNIREAPARLRKPSEPAMNAAGMKAYTEQVEDYARQIRDAIEGGKSALRKKAAAYDTTTPEPSKPISTGFLQRAGDVLHNTLTPTERYSYLRRDFDAGVQQAGEAQIQVQKQSTGYYNRFHADALPKEPRKAAWVEAALVKLGWHNRVEKLRGEAFDEALEAGLTEAEAREYADSVATKIPDCGADVAARLKADPAVRKAALYWLENISTMQEENLRRSGQGVQGWSAEAKNYADPLDGLMINLPPDRPADPEHFGTRRRSYSQAEALLDPTTGEGEYLTNYRRVLQNNIEYPIRVRAKADLANAVEKGGFAFDPQDPAVRVAPDGRMYVTVKGKEHLGRAVLMDDADGIPQPKIVPQDIIDVAKFAKPQTESKDKMAAKILNSYITARLAIGADVGYHVWRELGNVGAVLAREGNVANLIPWLGGRSLAAARSYRLATTPRGEMLQVFLERTGSDRGTGYYVREHEPHTITQKVIRFGHEMLFDPKFGADVNLRRVLAESFIRIQIGPEAYERIANAVDSGRMSKAQAADMIADRLGAQKMLDAKNFINRTVGENNHLLRSEFLNKLQFMFPFIGQNVGTLPGEARRFLTANLTFKDVATHWQRGDRIRAATSIVGSLMSGVLGTYLAANLINYGVTALGDKDKKGKWLWENPPGYRDAPFILPGVAWGSSSPGDARPARVFGLTQMLNFKDVKGGIAGIPRNIVNEIMGAMPLMQPIFALAGKQPYITRKNELMSAESGDINPVSVGGETVSHGIQLLKGETPRRSLGQTVASDVAGFAGQRLRFLNPHAPQNDFDQFVREHGYQAGAMSDEDRELYVRRRELINDLRTGKSDIGAAILRGDIKPDQRNRIHAEAQYASDAMAKFGRLELPAAVEALEKFPEVRTQNARHTQTEEYGVKRYSQNWDDAWTVTYRRLQSARKDAKGGERSELDALWRRLLAIKPEK